MKTLKKRKACLSLMQLILLRTLLMAELPDSAADEWIRCKVGSAAMALERKHAGEQLL